MAEAAVTLARAVNEALNSFIPRYQVTLEALGVSEDSVKSLHALAGSQLTSEDPASEVLSKLAALNQSAEAVQAARDNQQETLREADKILNTIFDHGMKFLEMMGEQKVIEERKALIAQSESAHYFPPLVREKARSLNAAAPAIAMFMGAKFKLMGELVENSKAANEELAQFLPQYEAGLKQLGASEDVLKSLAALNEASSSSENPAAAIHAKLKSLKELAISSQSSLEQHKAALKEADASVNEIFEHGMKFLEMIGEEKVIKERRTLMAESETAQYLPPLLQNKFRSLISAAPAIAVFVGGKMKLLGEWVAAGGLLNQEVNRLAAMHEAALLALGVAEGLRAAVSTAAAAAPESPNDLVAKVKALADAAQAARAA